LCPQGQAVGTRLPAQPRPHTHPGPSPAQVSASSVAAEGLFPRPRPQTTPRRSPNLTAPCSALSLLYIVPSHHARPVTLLRRPHARTRARRPQSSRTC